MIFSSETLLFFWIVIFRHHKTSLFSPSNRGRNKRYFYGLKVWMQHWNVQKAHKTNWNSISSRLARLAPYSQLRRQNRRTRRELNGFTAHIICSNICAHKIICRVKNLYWKRHERCAPKCFCLLVSFTKALQLKFLTLFRNGLLKYCPCFWSKCRCVYIARMGGGAFQGW